MIDSCGTVHTTSQSENTHVRMTLPSDSRNYCHLMPQFITSISSDKILESNI